MAFVIQKTIMQHVSMMGWIVVVILNAKNGMPALLVPYINRIAFLKNSLMKNVMLSLIPRFVYMTWDNAAMLPYHIMLSPFVVIQKIVS